MTDIKTDHHIKVSGLITLLKVILEEHGDCDVVLSADGEGNGYSPLASWNFGYYEPDSTWSGEFRSAAHIKLPDYDEEDVAYFENETIKAIVLWPVN